MTFITEDFMLKNETAKMLYHKYAENMPIIDYHCHLSPKLIAENYRFKNAYDLFLSGDHYKWRLMRTAGISEELITGSADDFEKWNAFACCVPMMIGNPMYHWTHLELKRYFGIDTLLSPETAKEIWDQISRCLDKEEYRVQGLIAMSNVELICTTDKPGDTLNYHQTIRDTADFRTCVLPAFRPDLDSIPNNITEKMDYFHQNGCRLSDHAVDKMDDDVIDKLVFLGREYARRGWVMQLHIGALRNNNTRMHKKLGADTGFDSINDFRVAEGLSRLMDTLEKEDLLPKTILYTLNPKDNYVLAAMLGSFQKAPAAGKIQFGSGWWFNDQRDGIEGQMRALANLGLLSEFVGMLTDSRSFVSYTRHEYFRRILCSLIGKWVENGEYPKDEKLLGKIVQKICYENAKEYFKFNMWSGII